MSHSYDTSQEQKELIEKSKKGNRVAQKAIYEAYVDAMYATSLRIVGNRHDAEDIVQDSFIKAFRNLKSFKYKSTFGAWLKRIVINGCYDLLKKNKLETEGITDQNEWIESDASVEPEMTIETIKQGLKCLSQGYRRILSLYLFEGYDHQEISEIEGIAVSTSKSQYMRGKKQLMTILKTKPWMN